MHVRRERATDHEPVRALHRAAVSRRAADRTDEVAEMRLTDELREDVGFLPTLPLEEWTLAPLIGLAAVATVLLVAGCTGSRRRDTALG